MMDVEEFWALIEKSREGAPEGAARGQRLAVLLAALSAEEILAFQRQFAERVVDAYRWDWMAVACIVNDDATAEGFDGFVGWVMGQGQDYFEAALDDPERAADRAEPGKQADLRSLWTAPSEAYKKVTGRDDFSENAEPISIVMEGDRWQREKLSEMYPELVKRFRG